MGLLFIISALIVVGRQIALVGIEFFYDHITSSEITNEKISIGMLVFGGVFIAYGMRRQAI